MFFKYVLPFLMISLVFLPSKLLSQGKDPSGILSETKIKLSFTETPRVQAGNLGDYGNPKMKWLVIEAVYKLPLKTDSKSEVMWIDEMKVVFEVLYPSIYQGQNIYSLMKGDVIYWSIPLDGKKHYAMGYIPPQIILRYGRTGLRIKSSLTRELEARISFFDKSNRLLGRIYYRPRNISLKATAIRFEKAEKDLGVLKLDNVILPRDETPWAHLQWDKYELLKFNQKK